ncbi:MULTISPECIES: hypothetical protein [Pigmentiphaga]|uniref:Phage holin T7 family, holin superfamily II n=1 Tax=Pigmentiphaga daeguensis TaxID=414049 RepID=A0ABP3LSC4_9BURK
MNEVAVEAAKATPPTSVVAISWLSDWNLNHGVALATIGYILLQAGYLIWKWRREARK